MSLTKTTTSTICCSKTIILFPLLISLYGFIFTDDNSINASNEDFIDSIDASQLSQVIFNF